MLSLGTVTPEELAKARQRVQANTPAAVVRMGKLVDSYWAELRRAPAEGKKVAWHVAGPGTIFTVAAGMPTLLHAAYAPYCTARRWEEAPLQLANEDIGFLPDTCSYIRVQMALLEAWETGQIERLRSELRIPKPELVTCGRHCTEHSTLAEMAARRVGCPVVVLDFSSQGCVTEADFRQRARYCERQMREELVPAIERVSGRPYDYAKLSEMVSYLKQTALLRDEVLELMKNRPSPCGMFDLGISVGALIAEMGRPETVEYYREFYEECRDRVAKGIGVIPKEKYRIYWDGYSTWSVLGTVMRALSPRGGIPIMGRYLWGFYPHPEELDPDDPFYSIAYSMIRHTATKIFPQTAKDTVMELINDYQINGLIMLSFLTCRMWNVGQPEIAEMAERRFGIPSLIVPADVVDRTHFNEAQFNMRVEAFLEMIDARGKTF